MSIWKYFTRVLSEKEKRKDEGLPEPTGLLSKSVPVKAIELANTKVKKLVQPDVACARDSGGKSSQGGLYLMLTPAQRYEVGKRAAEHGTTCAMHYFLRSIRILS